MKKYILGLAALLALSTILTGCGGDSPADGALSAEDVAYAEPIVDNILAGIKDRDYAVFSRDFSDTMKTLMPEESLDSLADLLASKVGEYQSRSFAQAADVTQNGAQYTVVTYTAKFSDEPGDVLIIVTFGGDTEKKVDGLFFNSPKLREQ
ncbi:MAG: DUF3887 domain-containing protein [Burkholderiales bacterium]